MAESTVAAEESSPGKMRRKSLLGRKVGMTQVFDEAGKLIPVTVLEAGPCTVLQIKTPDNDGYSAVQIGYGKKRKPRKPQAALFASVGVEGVRWIREVPFVDPSSRIEPVEGETEIKPGDRVGASVFSDVKWVDVRGISKGRGFAGVIKRHGFNAGPKSHGSKNIRQPGSTGMHTEPGKVTKGRKMPGHYGAKQRKARNLQVIELDLENNRLLVRGSVPGPNGGFLFIEESLRKA